MTIRLYGASLSARFARGDLALTAHRTGNKVVVVGPTDLGPSGGKRGSADPRATVCRSGDWPGARSSECGPRLPANPEDFP
jgi:hypothetical protein